MVASIRPNLTPEIAMILSLRVLAAAGLLSLASSALAEQAVRDEFPNGAQRGERFEHVTKEQWGHEQVRLAQNAMHITRSLDLAVILNAPLLQAESDLKIENAIYAVDYDPSSKEFSIIHKPTGKAFAKNAKFENGGGKAAIIPIKDKTFGEGQAIEIISPNGNSDRITLCPDLPFVLFSGKLHNGTTEAITHNKVRTFSAAVETGAALSEVKTLGTGGLLSPDKNPGSYAFLTMANPASRSGVVGGWITHDRGSGAVFSPVADGAVRMQAQIDYGKLRIKPGADAETETFAMGWFDDARLGMESYADAIAKVYSVKLPTQMAGFCTWYMEKNAAACDEVHLPEVSAVAAKELKPFGFDFIQIDDEWQDGEKLNGPKKNFTTHAPNGPYPSGMKKAQEGISSLGLVPGIWFMPFAGTYNDPHFKDHQDWFVKTPEGKPYDTAWGGTCLDMTNPAAQEYVRSIVHRISNDWGYRFFKMDGFWTGSATKQVYVNNGYVEDGIGDATFYNPDKTNIEAMRDGTRLVRAAAGPDVFLLGCCVSQNMRSFGGTFGLLDAMRVGPDTGGNIGSPHGSRLWFLNGRVWWNDPDCVFVRKSTHLDRARLNASWTAIAGQLFYVSDWMPETPPERLDIVKRCIPAHGLAARPVDVFESDVAKVWLLTDTRQAARRDVVGLYNWSDNSDNISIKADRVGLPPASGYVAFDFWADKFIPPFRDTITASMPPNSCRILAVRPVSEMPQVLSTSRHVTQGIVDLTDEKWDAAKSALSGTSKVVANDRYELRIVLPVGAKSWRATAVNVSADDATAGVKATLKQDGAKLRVALTSGASREVKWTVSFEPAQIKLATPAAVTELKATNHFPGVSLSWADGQTDSYRIERNDGVVFNSPVNSLTDTSAKFDVSYQYRVTAMNWSGGSSPAAAVEITPTLPKPPAVPPAPTIHLGDLRATKVTNGWGAPTPNKSIGRGPLLINGKTYANGIGVHANATLIYDIPAKATRFVAVVGLDDAKKSDPHSSVVFEVYGNVKELGEKPVLLGRSSVLSNRTVRNWAFDLELNSRYKELHLVVTEADNGITADHADWVDVGFIIGTGK